MRMFAQSSLDAADRGLCKELVLGCVRWRDLLDRLVADRQKGSRRQLPPVRCLLRMGLYQITLLDRIPAHAAVSETVGLAQRCGQKQHMAFINAVLRAYADDANHTRSVIATLQAQEPAVGWSHPAWLVRDWIQRYGADDARRLMEWNNQAAASYARVNRLRAQPAGVLERWASEGVRATHVPLDWAEDGDLYLVTLPCAVHLLKSFEDGLFYMQDPSTLLAVHALDVKPGQFLVDLCAAPGGKTSLIAQKMGNAGTLLASDIDAERLQLVRENGLRLGVTCLHTSPASSLAATLHPLFLAHQLGQAGVSDPLMPGAESVLEVRGGKVGGEEGGGAAGELGDDSGKNSQKYSLYDFYIVNILGP